MVRLIFVFLTALPFFFFSVSITGIDEKRARLLLKAMDRAFTAAGILTAKDRAYALGYDASQYSRVMALEKHPSFYHVLGVKNTTYLIALLSDLLFEYVKLTATELASEIAEDFRRRA